MTTASLADLAAGPLGPTLDRIAAALAASARDESSIRFGLQVWTWKILMDHGIDDPARIEAAYDMLRQAIVARCHRCLAVDRGCLGSA